MIKSIYIRNMNKKKVFFLTKESLDGINVVIIQKILQFQCSPLGFLPFLRMVQFIFIDVIMRPTTPGEELGANT